MVVAAVSAMVAGACFAVAGILQQRAASSRPEDESLSPRLLLDLARQKTWVLGITFALLSYGFQSLALAFGPLSLVQAVLVSELIFAVPISARLHHVKVGPRVWLGAAAVAGGLVVGLLSAAPKEGDPSASLGGWIGVVVAAAVIAGAAVLLGRHIHGVFRASMFAFAGATVMGSQSALLSVTIKHLQQGFVPLFTAWQTYLLVIASIVGLLLIQSSYQEGPLAASMPVFDTIEPTVAIVIGVLLFGESLAGGTLHHVGAVLGAAVAVAGIWILDTAPEIQRLHRKEQQEQEENEGAQASEERSSTTG